MMYPRFRCIYLASATALILMAGSGAASADQPVTGILNVSTEPTGAILELDGTRKGPTPQMLEIPVGVHEIRLSMEGYEDVRTRVSVVKDKVSKLFFNMKKPRPAPTMSVQVKPTFPEEALIRVHTPKDNQKPGTVLLATTPPGLLAYIDQYQIPQATPVSFDIRPGIYELTLRSNVGEILYRKTLFVRPEECVDLDIVVRRQRTIDYSDPWK